MTNNNIYNRIYESTYIHLYVFNVCFVIAQFYHFLASRTFLYVFTVHTHVCYGVQLYIINLLKYITSQASTPIRTNF